jgi:hypothetical protein
MLNQSFGLSSKIDIAVRTSKKYRACTESQMNLRRPTDPELTE